jgi:hypothetical protein
MVVAITLVAALKPPNPRATDGSLSHARRANALAKMLIVVVVLTEFILWLSRYAALKPLPNGRCHMSSGNQ